MTSEKFIWREWPRALLRSTTIFGLLMTALIWGAVEFHLRDADKSADALRLAAVVMTILIVVGVLVDIRSRIARQCTREQLDASEARARKKSHELELTLNHVSQGIMMIDASRTVAVVNRRAVELLDLPDTVHSRPALDAVMAYHLARQEYGENGESIDPQMWEGFKYGKFDGVKTYERTRPNGVTLEIRTTPLAEGGFVRTFTDISERKRYEKKIAHMAQHDPLTGLANRVLLRSDVESALARRRRGAENFALLMIDLDRFKAVNDTLGHPAGDTLLTMVAQRLRGCVREVDTIARIGGDEFAILQTATEDRESVEILARRIVEVVSAPYDIDGSPVDIGASIGIARSHDCPDIEQLFRNADLALYRVKSEGRNSFRLFVPEMDATAKERRQREADLRAARRGEAAMSRAVA